MRSKKTLYLQQVIIVSLIFCGSLPAAFEFQGLGWAAASANIRVVGEAHSDRFNVNPSLMRENPTGSIDLHYSKPFAGLDLQAGALSANFKAGRIPAVSVLQYFGDDVYSEIRYKGGLCFALAPELYSGVSLAYQQLSIQGFDSRAALTISTSISLDIANDLQVGSVLEHLMRLHDSVKIPQKFLFGVSYNSGPAMLSISVEKEAALPLEVCLGAVSSKDRKFQLAAGYRNLSRSISLGWRFRYKQIGMYYSWMNHPHLPVSNGFGFEAHFQ